MSAFGEWESFYVIVGSSAGALIGLQFVAISLIAELPIKSGEEQAGGAFATPSVAHFGAVLFLSALMSAPWEGAAAVSVIWGVLGLLGVVYSFIVARRMRLQEAYRPVLEDWLFHVHFPRLAYATLAVAALTARAWPHAAPFIVGAASLVLLFIGIRNAWDIVMYQVFVRRREVQEGEQQES